jgi:sterol desaturase/sphingolipid hydroxylase (fatty acid hydroxylase superfamily)
MKQAGHENGKLSAWGIFGIACFSTPCQSARVNWQSTALTLAATFAGLLVLEQIFPLRPRTTALLKRLWVNLAIAALAFLTASLLIKPLGRFALHWTSQKTFGLLQWIPLPASLKFVAGFLLMDLSFYYWHRANHWLPFLWRFHNVHHIDGDLDVSTAFRFHFGEILFSAAFRIVQILLLGVSGWTYAIYELVFQANTMFQHSNVRLPIGVERLLNAILVTPRMHAIHHSQVQRETDSNFSSVFPWWDRLHRSLELGIPQSSIVIGVPAYTGQEDRNFWQSLRLPFVRQRDYWRKPGGEAPARPASKEFPRRLQE